mmetsp:Transcript_62057/g.189511  ORF Transcript_62057/g.189511 Transcript_62057/m.189511 type:complete len:303 (-) Transcript_62057:150-1058(-)
MLDCLASTSRDFCTFSVCSSSSVVGPVADGFSTRTPSSRNSALRSSSSLEASTLNLAKRSLALLLLSLTGSSNERTVPTALNASSTAPASTRLSESVGKISLDVTPSPLPISRLRSRKVSKATCFLRSICFWRSASLRPRPFNFCTFVKALRISAFVMFGTAPPHCRTFSCISWATFCRPRNASKTACFRRFSSERPHPFNCCTFSCNMRASDWAFFLSTLSRDLPFAMSLACKPNALALTLSEPVLTFLPCALPPVVSCNICTSDWAFFLLVLVSRFLAFCLEVFCFLRSKAASPPSPQSL